MGWLLPLVHGDVSGLRCMAPISDPLTVAVNATTGKESGQWDRERRSGVRGQESAFGKLRPGREAMGMSVFFRRRNAFGGLARNLDGQGLLVILGSGKPSYVRVVRVEWFQRGQDRGRHNR